MGREFSFSDLKIQYLSPGNWAVTLPDVQGVVGMGTTAIKAVRAFKKQLYAAQCYAGTKLSPPLPY
jgi:hypothetical protein